MPKGRFHRVMAGERGPRPQSSKAERARIGVDPVALVLVITAVFVWLTDKPVHALFLGAVGLYLQWAVLRERSRGTIDRAAEPRTDDSVPGGGITSATVSSGSRPLAAAAHAGTITISEAEGEPRALQVRHTARRALLVGSALAFVLLVAAFPRFSWPATIAVVAVASWAVAKGAQMPTSSRTENTASDHCSRLGLAVWAIAFCAGALWELAALLQQPSLREGSYDHPTISVLMDSLLSGYWGRVLVLSLWLGFGWFLMREIRR